ncbi:hypothetical protein N9B44_00065 [bacterium]|nr:hypothetical protein [bacterium]
MPSRSLEHCSLHYLNQWIRHDSQCCQAFKFGTTTEKLSALSHAVSFYGISRNLPLRSDTNKGLPRFKPLLNALEQVKPQDFKSNPVAGIRKFESAIQKHYGSASKASLATKVLWLRLKRPIIIYDAQVRIAIGTRPGDLDSFYARWRESFETKNAEISQVCERLEKMGDYSVDHKLATPKYIRKVASTKWFRERVFDIYLWNLGAN